MTSGDKVTIKGENFGTKECLHNVSFSSAPGEKVQYTYVNDGTIEATVPNSKAGMSFVIVVAGSGSAQSKPLSFSTTFRRMALRYGLIELPQYFETPLPVMGEIND